MKVVTQRIADYDTVDEFHAWVGDERGKTPFFRPEPL